jgi:hypothetical protein
MEITVYAELGHLVPLGVPLVAALWSLLATPLKHRCPG